MEINNYESFQKLAPYHDNLYDFPDPLLNENFIIYLKYILKSPAINGNKFLDIGCGTGDFCFFMANLGYNVTGIDFSDNMLQVARNKLSIFKDAIEKRKNIPSLQELEKQNVLPPLIRVIPKIKFIKEDITNITDLKEQFNLITMFNTLSYINPNLLNKAFNNIYNLLYNECIFMFNFPTVVYFKYPDYPKFSNKFNCEYKYNFDEQNQIFTSSFNFLPNNFINEEFLINFTEFSHDLKNILDLVQKLNFKVISIIPNVPIYSESDSDLEIICHAIKSTYNLPHGVSNIIIILQKFI